MENREERMTLIVFSNDLDKATAAFILAVGAASGGMQVTMFFTFWGLSLLRKPGGSGAGKDLVGRLFGFMLPDGPGGTVLSKMHMGGLGTAMMKRVMRKKNMPDLAGMMATARELGVTIVACSTSMGMMGIRRDELAGDIEVGGVATYLGQARRSGINLFV